MKRILLALIAGTLLTFAVPGNASARPYYRGWGPGYYAPRAYVRPYRVYRPVVVRPGPYVPYAYPYAGGYYSGPGFYFGAGY